MASDSAQRAPGMPGSPAAEQALPVSSSDAEAIADASGPAALGESMHRHRGHRIVVRLNTAGGCVFHAELRPRSVLDWPLLENLAGSRLYVVHLVLAFVAYSVMIQQDVIYDSVPGIVALSWLLVNCSVFLTFFDRTICAIVLHQFAAYYMFWNLAVYIVLSGWTQRYGSDVGNAAAFLGFTVVMLAYIFWDAVHVPGWKSRRIQIVFGFIMLANCLRILVREWITDEQYTQDSFCVWSHCARVREAALSALTNLTVFIGQFTFSALIMDSPTVLRFALWRDFVSPSVQQWWACLPNSIAGVGQNVIRRWSSSPLTEGNNGKTTVFLAERPRAPVIQSRWMARIARKPLYGPFIVASFVAYMICDGFELLRYPPVAITFALIPTLGSPFELTRLDRTLLLHVLSEFNSVFILANVFLHIVAAALASRYHESETIYSAVAAAVINTVVGLWVLTLDASTSPALYKTVTSSLWVINSVRVFVRELTTPRYVQSDLCVVYCTTLASVAQSALANATIFYLQQALQTLYYGNRHLSVVNVVPIVTVKLNDSKDHRQSVSIPHPNEQGQPAASSASDEEADTETLATPPEQQSVDFVSI
jgi:hypothetical protein